MRGRHSYNRCSRAAAIFLSLIMTVTLSAQAVQAVAAPVKNRPVPEMSQIREMLEGRDYVEGDAIVVAEKSFDPAGFIRGDSEKLAEANEKSLSLTADAARETDSAVQEVAAERADISNARSYNISKVHSDSLDTAELIAKLYTSPKVISAEPNYIFNAAEAYAVEGGAQTDDPGDDAGKEKAGDQTGKESEGDQAGKENPDDQAGRDYKDDKGNKDDSGKVPDAKLNVKSGLSSTGRHDPDVGDLSSAQWYLGNGGGYNTLEGKGIAGVGMDVPKYTGSGTGTGNNSSPDSTIAILDSGMDVNHPDLQDQFYTFTDKQQTEYGCGVHGLNATADPSDPDYSAEVGNLRDTVDHGTHCSGIMVANWDGKGVAGVANGAKLVGVRLSEDSGRQTLEGNLRGFNFLIKCARDINLKSVNCSWGADAGVVEFTYTLLVNELGRNGVVTVFAAGNSQNDLDQTIETPSFIDSPYLLTVDSMNPAGNRSGFSNYGETQTDVFAPGSDILSTVPATVISDDPAGTPVTSTNSRYHPESDQGVIKRIKFSEQDYSDLVQVFEYDPSTTIGRQAGYEFVDSGTDDEASIKIGREHFKDPKLSDEDLQHRPGDSVILKVKVGQEVSPQSIKMITMRVATVLDLSSVIGTLYGVAAKNTSTNTTRMATLGYDTDGKIFSAQARGSVSAWGTATVNTDDLLAENEQVYIDDEGYIYLWLGVVEQRADYRQADYIYIDDITIGRGGAATVNENAHASAHIVFNGTSMAAPMVTAALGIVSKDEASNSHFQPGEGEGTLGMQALKRSARLRAATKHADRLEEDCATGGFVRLTPYKTAASTEEMPLAPIIASCAQTDDKSKKIEVSGWFFGSSKGSSVIKVDGEEATIESWSNEKIVIDLPAGTGNGAHVLRIQTADGIDKAPFSTSYDEASVTKPALYEYELAVPDPIKPNPDGNDGKLLPCMVATKDCIYTLQEDLSSSIIAVWCYDIHDDSWKMIEKPTEALMRVSAGSVMADTPDGFVLHASEQVGTDEYGNPNMKDYLYYYDAGSGSWSRKAFPEEVATGMSLFTRGNDLFFVGYGREVTIEGQVRHSVLEVLREGETQTECLGTAPDNYEYETFLTSCTIADCGGYIYLLGKGHVSEIHPYAYGLTRFRLDEDEEITDGKFFYKELADAGITKEGVLDIGVGMASLGCGIALVNRETEGTDTLILANGSDEFEEYERSSSFYSGNSQMAVHYGDYLYVFGYSPSEPGKVFFRATKLGIDHSWDDGEVTRKPIIDRPGEVTYTCTRCGYTDAEEIPYEGWEYRCIYGNGSEWLRGSRESLVFRFERRPEDKAYERYKRILIDGKELPGTNFDIERGSLVVKLKAPYLETLSTGKHTIRAEFSDGSAEASFTVVSSGSNKANTGDDRSVGTWLILLIVSATSLGALRIRRSRA